MTPLPWDRLLEAAAEARANAYAPYSEFRVGAAVWTEDGRLLSGCNVENSSYGLSICAERNAVAAAVRAGSGKVLAVAILADSRTPCPPCGACRQVLAEVGGPELRVRCHNLSGQVLEISLAELLPNAFSKDFL